jgi:hypothetical protein
VCDAETALDVDIHVEARLAHSKLNASNSRRFSTLHCVSWVRLTFQGC